MSLDMWRARALSAERANVALIERVAALEAEARPHRHDPGVQMAPVRRRHTRKRPARCVDAMHRSLDACCSDLSVFMEVAAVATLRCVSKEVHAALVTARPSGIGRIRLGSFQDRGRRVQDLLHFLRRVRHPDVMVELEKGVDVAGFPTRGFDLKGYAPAFGDEYDLPHMQRFIFAHNGSAFPREKEFPRRAVLEVVMKMSNLRKFGLCCLSVPEELFTSLAAHCPHLEAIGMAKCVGNRDRPVKVCGSAFAGFTALRFLQMDFHTYGGHMAWSVPSSVDVIFGSVLDRLEVLSLKGNWGSRITFIDYMSVLARSPRPSKLRRLTITVPLDGAGPMMQTFGRSRGIKVELAPA
uniref:F-box domain-containing protein n=1 Tax=Zooxanthella nutricula TaxID=1333877 RepID=A0A6U6KSE1_9DINO|mmetsp:Transcript_28585/g.86347  ORF Transcript_28585/g.86347 Transcript_28585/m.86347 type:complete len:353 (+) Transcript_28585:118-1176(+)